MSDLGALTRSEEGVDPFVEDPLFLRQAIHALGIKDPVARLTARARILSTGEYAPASLLLELERDRRKIKATARRVFLIVAAILLTGPLLAYLFGQGWILTVANTAAVAILLAACLIATRSSWHREASRMLAKYQGAETTRLMIDTLADVWGERQPLLREAIMHRLARVKAADASWLKGETRERVIALLSMPEWSSPTCVEEQLIIAQALAKVGATEAIPVLKGANCNSIKGDKGRQLRRGLDEVIRELEAIERRRKPGGDSQDPVLAVVAARPPKPPPTSGASRPSGKKRR